MNSLIGALIITMSRGGITPGTVPEEPSDFMPQIEEDQTLVFGPTKAEREAEAKRIAEEEARKAEEERLRKEEEERKAKEEAMKNPENLNYDHDIASCTTYYSVSAGNANRNYNMELASEAINGLILKPGDEFSYNDVILSHRTPERDYKPAGVISGGKIVNAIGGGICQVSSTLYNAALYSGMTITERRNHSLKVGYLPAGMDATASWGTIDFCFRNDLEVPVKIDSYVKDGVMKIRFLSPGDPNIGNIELKVTQYNGVYTLHRYVDGIEDYTANSVYRG